MMKAYLLVYFGNNSQAAVGRILGVSQQTVSADLRELQRLNPAIFPKFTNTPKIVSYDPSMDCLILIKF